LKSISKITTVQKGALLVVSVFLAFVIASSFSSSRSKNKGNVFTPTKLEVDAKVQTSQLLLQDFSRIMLKRGKKTLEVKAASGKFLPQDSITYLTQAEVKVQREGGKVVKFRSRNARLFMDGDQVHRADLEGDVVVEFDEGIEVFSELATYDADTQQVKIPDHAIIRGTGYQIEGDGLEAEIDSEVIRILRDVKSKFEKGASMPQLNFQLNSKSEASSQKP
jgi:LPS export ABC transporter protein LptC